jgi:DNA topoisomerase-1
VISSNGRYGPYIKCGSETRSLPAEVSPIDVTFDQAMALLAQPKVGGRGRAAKKEPIKTFEASPVTGNPVQLLDGRYGPYVTDGETNASLPREAKADELTFAQALELLAARAAAGGTTKKVKKKGATKSKPKPKSTKKTAAKAATSKATATKKAAAKKKA